MRASTELQGAADILYSSFASEYDIIIVLI